MEKFRWLKRHDIDFEDWVGINRAAKFLEMSEAALRQAVNRGQVPCAKYGKRLRFMLSELDAMVRKGHSRPEGQTPSDPIKFEASDE